MTQTPGLDVLLKLRDLDELRPATLERAPVAIRTDPYTKAEVELRHIRELAHELLAAVERALGQR